MHCLPKADQHALYMLNSVLFANLYSSQGKGLRRSLVQLPSSSILKDCAVSEFGKSPPLIEF